MLSSFAFYAVDYLVVGGVICSLRLLSGSRCVNGSCFFWMARWFALGPFWDDVVISFALDHLECPCVELNSSSLGQVTDVDFTPAAFGVVVDGAFP